MRGIRARASRGGGGGEEEEEEEKAVLRGKSCADACVEFLASQFTP